ncbi:MAG: type II secretion system protein [Pseudomonadales bacterium]|nr:type II secretion system protein [Pseudomonadales bacterium]
MTRQDLGRQQQARGFSLVEMVVSIVIAAILAAGVVSYIGDSVEGYAAGASRNKLSSAGRTVLDRLALELHNAVPNSVRTTVAEAGGNQCIEFIPFVGASTYIDPPFTGTGSDVFEMVDLNPVLHREAPADLYAVIYSIETAALYAMPNPGPIALIDKLRDRFDSILVSDVCTDDPIVAPGLAQGVTTVCLDASHRFARRSPVQRVYIAEQPVSFCVVDDSIYRYENYGFQTTQCEPTTPACLPTTAAAGRHLITNMIDNTGLQAFSVVEASLRRNAIIALEMNFTERGDQVQLQHEILQRNVP